MIKASEARNRVDKLKEQDGIEQLKKVDEAIEAAIEARKTTAPINFDINEIAERNILQNGYSLVKDPKTQVITAIKF